MSPLTTRPTSRPRPDRCWFCRSNLAALDYRLFVIRDVLEPVCSYCEDKAERPDEWLSETLDYMEEEA